MYDGSSRLLVANARYAKLLGLPETQVVPGTTLHELLDRSVAEGVMSADLADRTYARCSDLNRRHLAASYVQETTDGRSILINHQPMQNVGWVSTCEDITERRRAEARIAHMAHHDALAELPNRLSFNESLQGFFAHARRGARFAVLSLDLDHFKHVNETLGHASATRCCDPSLSVCVTRCAAQIRSADTGLNRWRRSMLLGQLPAAYF